MSRKSIFELSLKELEAVLINWGYESFHARQIFNWIYNKGAIDFRQMSDLPAGLRNKLAQNFYICGLKLKKSLESCDGTEKLLLGLEDDNLIEAVIIPTEKRITGCISSQAGCRFACGFCASGISGFKRNLTDIEMAEEVLYIKNHSLGKGKKLTHIVFMGTGEPLDNYENVLRAIRIINSSRRFNIGARRITISTCGIIPGIKKLADENLQIELSVSLHTADDKIRSVLMPVNKKYPLEDLIGACKEYINKTGRQVTFEYILIKGINSGLQNAQKLSTILKGLRLCKVNLIPSNPVKELKIAPPDSKDMLLFRGHLLKHGIPVTLRKPRGQDIDAGCGQLRLRYENI